MKTLATLLALSLMGTAALHAQEQQVDTTLQLGTLVVTGTRTPKLLKDTPVLTRLITHADISQTDATNVQDLLQQELPGVEFSYAMNQQVHMNMSGFGGQGVLFLVDGERLAGETMDDVDFTRLCMAGVERIEIVKGASSALYGSNAGGGVVNIITRDGGKPWTLHADARLARHHEQRYGLSWATNGRHLSNALDATYSGIHSYGVSNGPQPQARVFSTVYGNDTYQLKDKLTWRPTRYMKLTGRAGYFFRQLPRTPDTPERYRDFSGGLRALWMPSNRQNLEVAYSFDQYDKSDYQKLLHLDIRDYSNVQNSLRAVYNRALGADGSVGMLTLGADYMHDYLLNTNLDGRTREQDTYDAFAQLDWNATERLELVGVLRYDHASIGHSSRLTPKVNARYLLRPNLTLRMGYGMGFRTPTLKERYYNFDMAGIWIVQGNEQLKAEVSHQLNASAEWTRGHYNLTVAAYYNRVQNKLATGVPYARPDNARQLYLDYLNLDDYSVSGAEATLQASWSGGFSGRLSYAYTKEHLPKDRDGNTINNQYLPAREHSATLRLDWDRQFSSHYGLNVCLSGRVLSGVDNQEYIDYYDIARGTQRVSYPAYTIWKLSTTQRLGRAVRLTLALDNVLNYRPEYYYFNAPVTDGTCLQAGIAIDLDKL